MPSLDLIYNLLPHYGYLLLFPIAVIEGPIITIIAAFLASQGYLNIAVVYLVVVVADLVGDLLYYLIGRLGKQPMIKWWEKRLGLTQARLNRLKEHYISHGGRTLLIGKLTHSVGFIVLIAAGAAEMPLARQRHQVFELVEHRCGSLVCPWPISVIAGLDPAIHPLRKMFLRRGWTRGSSPRVTPVGGER